MPDEQTSVLDPRRDGATDKAAPKPATPALEPVDEPATRRWLAPVALLAAAALVAALVVWFTGADDPATSERAATATARPSATAPATTAPAAPTAAESAAPAESTAPGAPAATAAAPSGAPAGSSSAAPPSSALPAGWEARSFQGVTFAVPAGARMADVVDPGGNGASPLFAWNGPAVGGDIYSQISMWVLPADGATPPDTYRPVTVPGASSAFVLIGPGGTQPETVTVDLHMMTGDRHINLFAMFAAGATGDQMVQDLIASVVVG